MGPEMPVSSARSGLRAAAGESGDSGGQANTHAQGSLNHKDPNGPGLLRTQGTHVARGRFSAHSRSTPLHGYACPPLLAIGDATGPGSGTNAETGSKRSPMGPL